jgi:phosphotransferase system enzyme I (PtsI)
MQPASLLKVKREVLRADVSQLAPRVSRLVASDDPARSSHLLERLREPSAVFSSAGRGIV